MGGPCQRTKLEEVDVRPTGWKGREKNDLEDLGAWGDEIGKVGKGRAFVFSDGSPLESGNAGGGAFVVGSYGAKEEAECGIGGVATVWDGEAAGMARGLDRVRREKKVLILADSKAVIAAVRKPAGQERRDVDTCGRLLI